MRIMLVQNMMYLPDTGGANKGNRLLLEALARRGHQCQLLARSTSVQGYGDRSEFQQELSRRDVRLDCSSDTVDVFSHEGVEVHAIVSGAALRLHLKEQIRSFEPTWILVSSEDTGQVLLTTALKMQPQSVVCLARTTACLPCGPASFAPDPAGRESLRQVAGIAAISRFMQAYIARWGQAGAEVVRLPFITLRVESAPTRPPSQRGAVTMVNPCAIKGISIFTELAQRLPHVRFAAVPTWGTTQADMNQLRTLPNVEIMKAGEIGAIFSRTRVLLVPSLWAEGFGTVATQAMLQGIPVLAADVGGLPEAKLQIPYLLPVRPIEKYSQRTDDRLIPCPVVPAQNTDPWLEALRELLETPGVYEALSEKSTQVARLACANIEDPADTLLRYLQSLDRRAAKSPECSQTEEDNRPSAGDLDRRVAGLTPERRTLLALRALKGSLGAPAGLVVRPVSRDGAAPLSFAQERLWFLSRAEPDCRSAYNIQRAYRLTGPLDIERLQRALDGIVRRHEILRTTFCQRDGQAVQVVHPDATLPLRLVTIQGHTVETRWEKARRVLLSEASSHFDLDRCAPVRVVLIRIGPDENILCATMHHIISDGWSMTLFFRELETLYAGSGGHDAAPLAIQYTDYAAWQRRQLDHDRSRESLQWWVRQLEGIRPPIIPMDRPRPVNCSYGGTGAYGTLGPETTERLKLIGRQEHTTIAMTLLAAYVVLLSRLSGQDDIAVGCPVSGRCRPEMENLIGLFVNLLVLRARVSRDVTFNDLLRHVRDVTLQAHAHQEIPFERVVRAVRTSQNTRRAPLFQVLFNMLNYDTGQFHLDGTVAQRLALPDTRSVYDLALYAQEVEDQIALRLVYSTDVFDQDRAAGLLEQLSAILHQIGTSPGQSVGSYSTVTRAARRVLPDPQFPLSAPRQTSVVDHLRRQARENPEKAAIAYGGQAWCYGDFDAWTDRLATRLSESGVQRGDTVAISGGRCATLIFAMVGVLKAGAAFLILDPRLPKRRLDTLMEMARPRGWIDIVGRGRYLDGGSIVSGTGRPYLRMPTEAAHVRRFVQDLPCPQTALTIEPDDLAYIVFTSGTSTGRPKGILGTHGPLSHFLDWHCRTFGLKRSDRFSMMSGLTHDPLLRDVFTPLWIGATLCVPQQEDIDDPGRLTEWVRHNEVTVAHLTPAMAEVLALRRGPASRAPRQIASLRYAFFAGDSLTQRHVERFSQLAPNARCVNFYGATETPQAVGYYVVPDATQHPSSRQWNDEQTRLPIGKGIADAQLLILNQAGGRVGFGEVGQIHVRTPYLSKSYLDSRLTAERFVTNPFTGRPDDRLYRTGDLGRYRLNGDVDFLGRVDRQIKLRGFRIEPHEIEYVLCRHQAVRNAVVVLQPAPGTAGGLLVAYLVCESNVSTLALRRHLREFLPEHMIPARLVIVEALPLTPHGKIDYEALCSMPEAPEDAGAYVPPEGPTEREVARVWREMLGIDRVGRYDHFFDLGGHSLLTIKAADLLSERLGMTVPIREFFNQTLAQLAASCDRRLAGKERDDASARV